MDYNSSWRVKVLVKFVVTEHERDVSLVAKVR